MKKSETIKNIIDLIIEYTGSENFAELEWLFSELSTARILEDKESKKS